MQLNNNENAYNHPHKLAQQAHIKIKIFLVEQKDMKAQTHFFKTN